MLIGTALSIKGPSISREIHRPLIQDVYTTQVSVSLDIMDFRLVDFQNMVNIWFD